MHYYIIDKYFCSRGILDKAGKSLFMDLHHLVEGATHVTEAVAALAVGRPQRELLTVGRVVPRPLSVQI